MRGGRMILASIKPYYYYLIAEEKKKIEVRKTATELKNFDGLDITGVFS